MFKGIALYNALTPRGGAIESAGAHSARDWSFPVQSVPALLRSKLLALWAHSCRATERDISASLGF